MTAPRKADKDAVTAAMRGLEAVFPECAIVLLVTPVGAEAGRRVNYISNGQRDNMMAMLREVLDRLEGQRDEGTRH